MEYVAAVAVAAVVLYFVGKWVGKGGGKPKSPAGGEEPSPLVRDSLRGWRSGRLDLVLAGNFDAM